MATAPIAVSHDTGPGNSLAYNGSVAYRVAGAEDSGCAEWQSLGASGAALRLGRYLRPGRVIQLDLNGLSFPARVVWSRPADREGNFVSGLRFDATSPEPMLLTLGQISRRFDRSGAPASM